MPIGMFGAEHLDPIEGEGELIVIRLFRPQGAIVVEYGDAVGRGDIGGRSLLRNRRNERHDCRLGGIVLPGG